MDDILAGLVSVQIGIAIYMWRRTNRFTRALRRAGESADPAAAIERVLAQHQAVGRWTNWLMICVAVPTLGVAVWAIVDVSVH